MNADSRRLGRQPRVERRAVPGECLDSVVSQSIGLDRLKVLAVDDGSTDGSGPLLDQYAEQYPQVRIFHEPNSGGPGRPRNVGLDNAGVDCVGPAAG